MTTTRAETTHTSTPVMSWGLSVVNSIKGRARQHKEKMPLLKIGIAVIVLMVLMLIYVTYVNKASTYGYFYKVESQNLDDITFQYNLVKLDVLEQQQQLWRQVSTFDAWSDPAALRDRLIIVSLDNTTEITATSESEAVSHSTE